MTQEKEKATIIKAVTPPYVKAAVVEYVNKKNDMSVSQFAAQAIKHELQRLNVLQPPTKKV